MEIATDVKPALAFVGVGWIGRNRLQAVLESGNATVAWITDPSEACIEETLKLAPASRVAGSFEEVIRNPNVDGVVIATPSALHMCQTLAALGQGKAVFCQKPLGRDAEEVEAVLKAAHKANRLLGADFSYRYTEAFKSIFPLIRSGELGKIFSVDLTFHNAYGPDKAWFYDIKQSGGGCVLDLGIHLIDLMLYALDFPEVQKVSSNLFRKGRVVSAGDEVEDCAQVLLQLANDISVQLACSWNLPAGREAVIEVTFYGTQGGVSMKNIQGSFYDFAAYRFQGTRSVTLISPPDAWGGRALAHWLQRLTVSPEFDPSAFQYQSSANLLDRIYGRK